MESNNQSIQSADVPPQTAPDAAPSAAAQEKVPFDTLLQDPDYRRAYEERLHTAVNRRSRSAQSRRAAVEELARDMAARCGVSPEGTDLADLRRAIESLPVLTGQDAPEERADEEEDGSGEEPIRSAFRAAAAEGEALRGLYPDFDLGRELADPRFASLLVSLQRCGMPEAVRLAYEGAHHAALVTDAVRRATAHTARALAEGVRSGALRPAENGGAPAAPVRTDPARLTEEERRDIRRRVMQGERVTF